MFTICDIQATRFDCAVCSTIFAEYGNLPQLGLEGHCVAMGIWFLVVGAMLQNGQLPGIFEDKRNV